MVVISEFDIADQNSIREFVLNIQNVEFNMDFKENEQPDLFDNSNFYKKGCFWKAKIQDEIIGTIRLQQLDPKNSVLRNMFVKKEFRGKEYNISSLLFDKLIEFAKKKAQLQYGLTPQVLPQNLINFKNGMVLFLQIKNVCLLITFSLIKIQKSIY